MGIGTDILLISRMEKILGDAEALEIFLKRNFTQKEILLINSVPRPSRRYAGHFAGKEAVFKSLDLDSNISYSFCEIEILYNQNGVPQVFFHGDIRRIVEKKGIQSVMLSLSYDGEYALAFASSESDR